MGDERRSADDVWLDAMEARDLADRDNFVELRAKALEINPHHEDAVSYTHLTLPTIYSL